MTVADLLIDFGIASVLILIGQLMRSKLKIFQKFFIPASVLAGFLGLIFGPNVLGWLPFTENISTYAGFLIILVFTVVGINGFEIAKGSGKEQTKRILGYQIFKVLTWSLQIMVPLFFTMWVLKPLFPTLNDGFAMLLHSGFYGGHGTAAAVGQTFYDLGWTEARDIAMTFATIGILTGVFVGILFINIAAKKGQTAYLKDFKNIDPEMKTGLIPQNLRKSFGQETISPISLDTLTFHLGLVLAVAGGAYMLNSWIGENLLSGIPDFTVAFLVALIIFLCLRKTPVYTYVDKNINNRIAGTSTDYLVFFGIAAIKLDVVLAYAGPIIFSVLLGIFLVAIIIWPFGRAYNTDNWFERSIFVFGNYTGVFAIGFVLFRIVDPENKSGTIEDTAMTPATNIAEIAIWSTFPALLISGQWMIAGIASVLIVIAMVVLTKLTGTWVYNVPDSERNVLKNKMN